jgi:glutathione synthase
MKIGFVVNQIKKEANPYTTTSLALQATRMGHEVYYIGIGDLAYLEDEQMGAHAIKAPDKQFRTNATFLEAVKKEQKHLVTPKELDILMLRNDPSEDYMNRSWAQNGGMVFGRLAQKHGVVVLNDPRTLAQAGNKMYFQYFPKTVRPETIITRHIEDIKSFYKDHDKNIVLKPLQGSGGKNVFLINEETKNLNQIVEAIARDGFVVAQEYLPAAQNGDIRLFLLDGRPIVVDGQTAAIHRTQAKNDIRSNIHQGGQVKKPKLTKKVNELVEEVAPKLIKDGMFFVGLDIVGDKLMEINVFSPGGLGHASRIHKVDFFEPVIKAMERKVL